MTRVRVIAGLLSLLASAAHAADAPPYNQWCELNAKKPIAHFQTAHTELNEPGMSEAEGWRKVEIGVWMDTACVGGCPHDVQKWTRINPDWTKYHINECPESQRREYD